MQVNDFTIHLHPVQRPGNFHAEVGGGVVSMIASPLQVNANCQVVANDSSAPNLAPVSREDPRKANWKLGFMQAQILETTWAYYRGAQSEQGCVLNDLAARRRLQICRDYEPKLGTIWYEGSGNIYDCYGRPDTSRPSPWNLEFYFGDKPKQDVPDRVLNAQTQRSNYLHEARATMAFVTTLTEQITPGIFKHHRHFFWSVNWHIRSKIAGPVSTADLVALPGSGFWISDIKRGAPTDPRYVNVLNNPSLTPSCNEIARDAPVAQSTSSSWQRFPLMDQKDKLF